MREIKFRAWDNKTNTMCLVTGLTFSNSGNICAVTIQNNPLEDITRNIKDVILMQHTNLKDKNGKELFEGDIILKDEILKSKDCLRIVEWRDDAPSFILRNVFPNKYGRKDFCTLVTEYDMRIIGNVFENKELLK